MSLKRSSTSYGNSLLRPRYLGIEVAGDPLFSPKRLGHWLADRLGGAEAAALVRVIRVEGRRAVVSLPHTWVGRARAGWSGRWTTPDGAALEVRTYRTWGTLVGAKRWLRLHPASSEVGALKYGRRP